jgi:hypothetical protein
MMSQPGRKTPSVEEPPIYDQAAIERAYRRHRARRRARIERRRANRLARVRFWAVLGALFLGCLVLAVTIWIEVGQLFGL